MDILALYFLVLRIAIEYVIRVVQFLKHKIE